MRLQRGRRLGDLRIVAAEGADRRQLPDETAAAFHRLRQLPHAEDRRRQLRCGIARRCRRHFQRAHLLGEAGGIGRLALQTGEPLGKLIRLLATALPGLRREAIDGLPQIGDRPLQRIEPRGDGSHLVAQPGFPGIEVLERRGHLLQGIGLRRFRHLQSRLEVAEPRRRTRSTDQQQHQQRP